METRMTLSSGTWQEEVGWRWVVKWLSTEAQKKSRFMQLKCSFLSFASRMWTENQLFLWVPSGTKLKVNMVFIKVSFIVIACFRLEIHVFGHDAFYLYVFIYWPEHLIPFNTSRTLPPSQPSPKAPTSLWLIRIMRLATSQQPFGTGWANMTKTLRL